MADQQIFVHPATIEGPQANSSLQHNWNATMRHAVPVDNPELSSLGVSPADRFEIGAAHPSGVAHVWGHTSDFFSQKAQPGDLVFFYGGFHFHHIGIIGAPFRSLPFGRKYWLPYSEGAEDYGYAYTLTALMPTADSPTLHDLFTSAGIEGVPGNAHYRTIGTASPERAAAMRAYFASAIDQLEREARIESVAADSGELREIRDAKTSGAAVTIAAREYVLAQREAALVRAYREWSREHHGVDVRRLKRHEFGEVDAVINENDGTLTLVEAKADASPEAVRMAIGQVLHYFATTTSASQITRLAVLTGTEPRHDLIDLLGALGIDAIFPATDGGFVRMEADSGRTERLLSLLS